MEVDLLNNCHILLKKSNIIAVLALPVCQMDYTVLLVQLLKMLYQQVVLLILLAERMPILFKYSMKNPQKLYGVLLYKQDVLMIRTKAKSYHFTSVWDGANQLGCHGYVSPSTCFDYTVYADDAKGSPIIEIKNK